MGYEKEHENNEVAQDVCVVESLDGNGSTAGRETFRTQADGEAYAAKMRADGFTVTISPLTAESPGSV